MNLILVYIPGELLFISQKFKAINITEQNLATCFFTFLMFLPSNPLATATAKLMLQSQSCSLRERCPDQSKTSPRHCCYVPIHYSVLSVSATKKSNLENCLSDVVCSFCQYTEWVRLSSQRIRLRYVLILSNFQSSTLAGTTNQLSVIQFCLS